MQWIQTATTLHTPSKSVVSARPTFTRWQRGFGNGHGHSNRGLFPTGLTATDSPSNVPGQELSATKLSPPFHVDTLAPTVTDLKAHRVAGKGIEVHGIAVDESSPIKRVEVSIDGRSYRALAASDGLFDSPKEEFQGIVPLEANDDGSWIAVRIQDGAGNRGIYRVWLSD